jgi:small-conductance mechanosensitive channel
LNNLLKWFLVAVCLAAAQGALAGDAAMGTRVGGDLADLKGKLAPLEDAGTRVFQAVPGAYGELAAALGRIHDARDKSAMTANAWRGVVSILLLWAAVLVFRRMTARARARVLNDALHARGAVLMLALELANWAVLAAGAYLLVKFFFDSDGHQELLGVALLWAIMRWRLFMVLLATVLRPGIPHFRLIAMSDAAARQVQAILAVTVFIGFAGISAMPVLLRAELPVPAGQVIVLLQGILVAAGCTLALWRYGAAHPAPSLAARLWLWLGGAAVLLLWLVWSVDVLLLEFSGYDALAWSLRIAVLAYVLDALLGLSAHSSRVQFLQRSITAAAVLAIAIVLAQVWLVEELALVPVATWVSVRRSLITASVTLFLGYVAWRYLHHWTEARLRAAAPGPVPGGEPDADAEEEGATPASRLTTILPMLRVLAGIAILLIVALLALSQLGVEITPLLAGASVFGLAISFGSQALVRDIVSGIFFMADDAFRVGEYIDTGRLKGTVERISLRSVRLRHQNGQVHTIPYGQLTSITNFSRDWQTVKFNLRLARDTDIEKLRKTVKQLGQEMQKDPELAKELLQPLKLQGVADIADSALVVRLKFTVRPLKPSWVQREALKRIYRVFGEKGIEFASNAIVVQTTGQTGVPREVAGAAAAASALPPEA